MVDGVPSVNGCSKPYLFVMLQTQKQNVLSTSQFAGPDSRLIAAKHFAASAQSSEPYIVAKLLQYLCIYTNGVIQVWGTYQPSCSFLKVVKSPSLLGQILLFGLELFQILLAPPLLLHHQPTAGWILLPSTSPLRLGRLQTEVLASRSPVGGYLILRTDPVVCPDCNIQDALGSNIIREIAD